MAQTQIASTSVGPVYATVANLFVPGLDDRYADLYQIARPWIIVNSQ